MHIEAATVYQVVLPMHFVFQTAKVALPQRDTVIVRLHTAAGDGWGEDVAFTIPFYTPETLAEDWEVLTKQYLPRLRGQACTSVTALHAMLDEADAVLADTEDAREAYVYGLAPSVLRGGRARYPMARAAVETAWLWAKSVQAGQSLVSTFMGQAVRSRIPMGVAIGLIPEESVVERVAAYVAEGCQRIKLKVTPDCAEARVAKVREAFPHLTLLVDANRAYPISAWRKVAALDAYGLACIEEPFLYDAIEEAEGMQQRVETPICLDESIQSLQDWQQAKRLQVGSMLNIKVGKFGGLYPTRAVIQQCQVEGTPFWIGSMVESAISKQLHAQLSGLSGNCMAGDLSASARYFPCELATPLTFSDGFETLPTGPGLGITVDEAALERYAVRKVTL